MRNFPVILFMLFFVIDLSAQNSRDELDRIQAGKDSIYIYKALGIEKFSYSDLSYSKDKLDLSEPIAAYSVFEPSPDLPRGNYWQLMNRNNVVYVRLYTVDEFNCEILRSFKNPEIFVYDNNGNPLKNTEIYFKGKTYRQNAGTHLIRLDETPNKDLNSLIVNHDGVHHYYRIWRRDKVKAERPEPKRFAALASPSIVSGYVPEYKCGDTIFMNRAIPQDSRIGFFDGRDKLYGTELKNKENSYIRFIVLSEECPYLKEGRISVYAGNVQDERADYLTDFEYVKYKYNLNAKVNSYKHLNIKPSELTIEVKEQDNNYSDKDYITVTAHTKKVRRAWKDSVYVPPILFGDTIPLTINNEIRYSLPQHAFPDADIDYRLETRLYKDNRLNDYHQFDMHSTGGDAFLVLSEKDHELRVEKIGITGSLPGKARVKGLNFDGTVTDREVDLPYVGKVNPVVWRYKIESDYLSDSINIRNKACPVECSVEPLGKDSMTVSLENPYGNSFWYTVWKKNRKLKTGYTSGIRFNLKNDKPEDLILRLEYLAENTFWEIQSTLAEDPRYIKPLKNNWHYSSGYAMFPRYYQDQNQRNVFDKISELQTVGEEKLSKYENILKSMVQAPSSNYRYFKPTWLNLSFKNTDEHKARYIILEDTLQKDPYDRITVFKASNNFYTELVRNRRYMLYVLSDSNLICKRPIELNKEGDFLLTIDMHSADCPDSIIANGLSYFTRSDSVNKQVESLLTPFAGKDFIRITVTDESGEPLPCVVVRIPNKSNLAAVTDLDGNVVFKLHSGFRGDIEVSFIGMETEKIRYKGQSFINVKLRERYELSD